jgi:hypothetical protein
VSAGVRRRKFDSNGRLSTKTIVIQSMARGPARRRTGGPNSPTKARGPQHKAGYVQQKKVVGSLGPDGRLKFLFATILANSW